MKLRYGKNVLFGPWGEFRSALSGASTGRYVGGWSGLHNCAASRFDSWSACWCDGVFSGLHVLVRAGGLAGMGALGRQEVNGACLVFLMNGS